MYISMVRLARVRPQAVIYMKTRQRDFVSLVREVQSGNKEAFHELIPTLQPVVNSIVNHVSSGRSWLGLSREDLIQEAWIAVYQALRTYDTITYPEPVHTFFRNAIKSRLITVGDRAYGVTMRRQLKRFLHDVRSGKVDWNLKDEELAQSYPSVSTTDVAHARFYGYSSWDVMACDGLDYGDTVRASVTASADVVADVVAERLDAIAILESFVKQLNEIEKKVLVLRFVQNKSRAAVSRELKYSVVKIQKIENEIGVKRGSINVNRSWC